MQLLKVTFPTLHTAKTNNSPEPEAKFLSEIESRCLLKVESADDDGAKKTFEPGIMLAKFFGRVWSFLFPKDTRCMLRSFQ